MALLLCSAVAVYAQVIVDAKVDAPEFRVGEQCHVTLEVSLDAKSQLVMPALKAGDLLIEGVEVVDVARPDTQWINEGARMTIVQDYTITSFDSALYNLPPFVVSVDGREYESRGHLALNVLTVPVDTLHLDNFYGPKEIMDAPFSWRYDVAPIFYWSLLLCCWVALLCYLYIRFRDNKPIIKIVKLAPKVPPHTAAMQEIDQIKAEKAWAKEDSKDYYTRLTAILRTYIEKRYGFSAMEMTSAEIIARLLEVQDKESLAELRTLFQTADLVKFAKYSTLINENDANLVNAIDFINHTKVEADEHAQTVPDEVKIEQKRSRRTLLSMRLGLVVMTFAGIALLTYIISMIYNLVA